MVREPAGRHGPELPVIAEPLELAVASHRGAGAALHQVPDELGVPGKDVLLLQEPSGLAGAAPRPGPPPPGAPVQALPGHEPLELLVPLHVLGGVEEVLAEGPSVGHQKGGGVRGLGRLEELDHVLVEGVMGRLCSIPGYPSMAWVTLSLKSSPPSVVGMISSSRRVDDPLALLPVPDMYIFRVFVPQYSL
jgi:hypothetical protein